MIHKHVTMRDFLRNPEQSLPKQPDDTTFVFRQSKAGPQVFALNVASLGTPDISAMSQLKDNVTNLKKEEPANDKKE